MPDEPATSSPGLRASRIAGPSGGPRTARAVVVASPAERRLRSGPWGETTDPAFGPHARAGLLFILICVAGLLVANLVPWILVRGDNLMRDEVQDQGLGGRGVFWDTSLDYTRSLTRAPLVSLSLLGLAGFLLVVIDAVPATRALQTGARLLVSLLAAFAALWLVVVFARWMGVYLAETMDFGRLRFQLHAGLYLLGLLGLAGLAIAARSLQRVAQAVRVQSGPGNYPAALPLAAWTLAAATATLALSPLLPLASNLEADVELSEVELIQLGQAAGGLSEAARNAARDLSTIRLSLWLVWVVAALSFSAALLERTGLLPLLSGTLLQTYALNGVLVVLGLVFAGLLYFGDLADLGGGAGLALGAAELQPVWNWFPLAGLVALAYLLLRYVPAVVLPFFRRELAARTGTVGESP